MFYSTIWIALFFRTEDTSFWAVHCVDSDIRLDSDGNIIDIERETVSRVTLERRRCEVNLEKVGLFGSGYASRGGKSCNNTEIPSI